MKVATRTLAEWLALQEQVHARAIDLGLGRVGAVARTLGVQRPRYRVITVAGTNGKGSTVATLEMLLLTLGFSVGSLTSPHLLRYNERIHVAGREATDAELVGVFERIEAARGATTLTFFEYNTLAALLLFADHQVEVAVLEVGLGGRLDAVNLVDADVGVLCSVGMDHRDWLGDTLDAIGAEKAGIFRSGHPAVLGTPQMPDSVYAAIERLGARAVIAERQFSWNIGPHSWTYRGLGGEFAGLPAPRLAGAIQYRNAATALAALEALAGFAGAQLRPAPLSRELIATALARVQVAGRFQIIAGPVEWILDVSHNEPAAQILKANLQARPVTGRTLAVCGILQDKDAGEIARVLAGSATLWIACALPGPRGGTAAALAQRLAPHVRVSEQAGSVAEGCARARVLARPGDRVLVFGSFSTVTAALEWLELT
ncbi:MAG TPA: bifunctional tetrahydrofolate synthase/dihydrofolate synthase [Steroidobacteraceae bacterium]|jgi:dihydrofolate synthase/folylpolyglutamate synthase|nr:bifunctional tetrahydrofolate synthase/dihydrofolate synthase [Steroidobacteraceae bacterium]